MPNTKNRTWKITIHTHEFCYISVFLYCDTVVWIDWIVQPDPSLCDNVGEKGSGMIKQLIKTEHCIWLCVFVVYTGLLHFMNIMVGLLMYFRSEGGRYCCLSGAYQRPAYGQCTDERTVWVCIVSRRWGGSSFIESAALNTSTLTLRELYPHLFLITAVSSHTNDRRLCCYLWVA